MNPHKLFQKVFLLLAFTLIVLQAAYLGADLQANDGKEAVVDGILLVFWIFTFGLFMLMNRAEAKLDRELEESKKNLDKAMGDMFGAIKKDIDHRAKIEKALHDSLEVIGADRPPKPSEFKKVEDKFHELTGDHYLKLTVEKGEKRTNAEVSNEPFTTPVKKKAPAKKGATNVKAKTRR